MTSAWTRETPIGALTLTEEAGVLTGVLFGPHAPQGALIAETSLIRRAFAQLEEYFCGERTVFDDVIEVRPFEIRPDEPLRNVRPAADLTLAGRKRLPGMAVSDGNGIFLYRRKFFKNKIRRRALLFLFLRRGARSLFSVFAA